MNQSPTPLNIDAMATITDDDFREFLNEKVKNHACPSCTTNSWAVVTAPGMLLALIAVTKKGEMLISPPITPFMAVACNSCGYIKQHAMGMIAHWKAAKSASV